MDKPRICQKGPVVIAVKQGETYFWCACGRSAKQPFCDGSHQGTSLQPVAFRADRDENMALCACKYTGDPPFCDGAHKDL